MIFIGARLATVGCQDLVFMRKTHLALCAPPLALFLPDGIFFIGMQMPLFGLSRVVHRFLAASLCVCAGTAFAQATVYQAPVAKLAVLGDSIAKGYGMAVGEWFSAPGSRWQVANWGVVSSGLASPGVYDWTRGAPSLIQQYAPNVVLISIGANDTRSMVMPDGSTAEFGEDRWTREYARRICALSQLGKDVGAQVIIAPPPAFADPKREAQLTLIRQIDNYCAIKTGARFVSLPAQLSTPALAKAPEFRAADGVHMTQAGYRLGAETVLRSALR